MQQRTGRLIAATAVFVLLGTGTASAAGTPLGRWQHRAAVRQKLLDDARARHVYWQHHRRQVRHETASDRWKARNMAAARRRDVKHRTFQLAYAQRVVARHTPVVRRVVQPTGGGGSGGHSGPLPPAYIKQCESHGNYSARNPSSGAYGAWQVLPSTHAAVCSDLGYSVWDQDECAARILRRQGLGAWVCA